jgi:flagellar biosynthesis/type III secretory pathway protein FliH
MKTRLHSRAFPLLSDFDRKDGGGKPDQESQLKSAFENGYQRGLADGRAEAQADGELRLAESEVLHATRLDEERQSWHRDCADVLAARFDASVKSIERKIEDRVAVLLRPWLIEQLRERALQDLEKAIARALSEGAKVHIEAPAEVLTQLRERLPTQALQIGYSDSGSPDIRAHIEDTAIEANISLWIAELEAATE